MEWNDKESMDISATSAGQRTPEGCIARLETLLTTAMPRERKRGVAINVRET